MIVSNRSNRIVVSNMWFPITFKSFFNYFLVYYLYIFLQQLKEIRKRLNIWINTCPTTVPTSQSFLNIQSSKLDICQHQNQNLIFFFFFFWKILGFFPRLRNVEGQKGENFSKLFFFIFLFRMTQFAKKSKKKNWKIWIFFLSLRNVGDFALFDPWRENQSFFGHAVFAKC